MFRCGHAADDHWEGAARSCAAQLDPGPGGANLGFVYVTDPFSPDLQQIIEFLRARTGIADWVGSVGTGICAPGTEYHDVPAMVVLEAVVPAGSYRIFSGIRDGLAQFEEQHGDWCREVRPRLGVVHGDPRVATVGPLLEKLSERMGSGFLVGGLSSAAESYHQVANGVTSGGLSGVMFDAQVTVSTRLTQGCKPMGDRHVVTACDGNIVYQLDGQPATEVLFGATGDLLARRPNLLGGYIFVGIPVRGSDTGDYIVRQIVALDREIGAVAINAPVTVGDGLMFCRRDGDAAASDLRRMTAEARRGLRGEPRGALYFSCVGRGPHLFGRANEELRMIAEELGDVPLAGFFGNGEISNNRLYGYTGVLALFA